MVDPKILNETAHSEARLSSVTNDTQFRFGEQMQLSGIERDNETKIFRPIHYIGSKLRIVEDICEAVDLVDPGGGPVCDLFAGSGTVSYAFSRSRDVTSVDVQEYSRVICNALLMPSSAITDTVERVRTEVLALDTSSQLCDAARPLIEFEEECMRQAAEGRLEPLCELLESGSIVMSEFADTATRSSNLQRRISKVVSRLERSGGDRSAKTTALRYFGGVYFSYRQAAHLDEISAIIDAHRKSESSDILTAALLSTASDIVNTVGKQFAQPIRPRDGKGEPKRHLVRQIRQDRAIDVIQTFAQWLGRYTGLNRADFTNVALKMDYLDALRCKDLNCNVVYADPPYTRDHYSRFYHVLETICLRDNPDVSKVKANGMESYSRGIYRVNRHQSKFCIRSQAPSAFEGMFNEIVRRGASLVLSYSPTTSYTGSRPRVMDIDDLIELAKQSFSRVEDHPVASISHSRLNSSANTLGHAKDAEMLLICKA